MRGISGVSAVRRGAVRIQEVQHMKAVVTRVNSASVSIDGSVCGRIGKGFLILLGVAPEDTPAKCRKLAEKILGLRVFRDENDKMNLSLSDVGGEVLVVSQFTLYGDVSHGRRPSFIGAGKPDIAIPLYEQFLSECERLRLPAAARRVRRIYAGRVRKRRTGYPDCRHK